jgi:hypothetical protein
LLATGNATTHRIARNIFAAEIFRREIETSLRIETIAGDALTAYKGHLNLADATGGSSQAPVIHADRRHFSDLRRNFR